MGGARAAEPQPASPGASARGCAPAMSAPPGPPGGRVPIAAILCDLDGTLLHTAPDITIAVNAMLCGLGRAPIAEGVVATHVGQGVDVLLHRVLGGGPDARVAPGLHARARRLFDAGYARINGRCASVYPGVVAGLDAFRALGLRLACVTNKPQRPAEAVLARFGLSRRFSCVIGGNALPQRKPEPEPLWHAARVLDVPRCACLVLGDSANDAKAARAAGMPVVLVDYGYTEGLPIGGIDCDAVIPAFTDLSAALAAAGPGTRRLPWIACSAAHGRIDAAR